MKHLSRNDPEWSTSWRVKLAKALILSEAKFVSAILGQDYRELLRTVRDQLKDEQQRKEKKP